jgi:hypothetical protein
MILGEIVSYACGKAGRSDDGFKAKVRTWAQLRRDMLWQQQLWKDSLAIYTKAVTAGQATVYLPAHIEKLVAARHDDTALLPVDQVFLFNDDPGMWERTGTPMEFSRPAASGVAVALPANGEKVNLVSGNAADVGKKVSIYGELNGEEVTELVLLNGTSAVQSVNTFTEIWQLSKEATAGQVTATGATSAATLVRLAAEQTEKRHPRLRFHETPVAAITLAVLAKRLPPPLRNDSDATGLPSLDNALLAFVSADALEHMRQYNKAAAKTKEGNAILERAMSTEIFHEAKGGRITPNDSVGDDDRPWE